MIWIIVILVLSFMPGDDLNKIQFLNIPHFDKLAHAGIYFILICILVFEINQNVLLRYTSNKILILSVLFCAILGLIIELFQPLFFTHRSAEWLDFTANLAGCLLGAGMIRFIQNSFAK